jgi:hypothetical protein
VTTLAAQLHWACAQGPAGLRARAPLAGTDAWAQNSKTHRALHVAAKYGVVDCCLELDAAGLQLLVVACAEGRRLWTSPAGPHEVYVRLSAYETAESCEARCL